MKRILLIFAAVIAIVMLAAVMYGLAQAEGCELPEPISIDEVVAVWGREPNPATPFCFNVDGNVFCMSADRYYQFCPERAPTVEPYPGIFPELPAYPGLFDVQAQEAEPEPVATRMVIVDNRRSR